LDVQRKIVAHRTKEQHVRAATLSVNKDQQFVQNQSVEKIRQGHLVSYEALNQVQHIRDHEHPNYKISPKKYVSCLL
jgi:hypothetical protein